MKIIVTKDKVKIEEFDLVHEGEHRVNKCSFSFSEDFTEDLVKKAIFTLQNDSIEVPIINNECDIPGEILKARNIVLLGVYAYKITGDKLVLRYSPSPDAFKVNSGSYIEGVSESEEITPSQFEQYMQALNNGLNKIEESLKKMDSATSSATQLVNDINQKLENGDFIGPEGPQGVPGKDGVGITTVTSGQSTVKEDKTITPVTVNKTDGSSQSFKVEAKNGQDGQNGKDGKDGVNGQDGLTPTIGENGNWYLGDTDTGKPSRGEVGPTPDLSDYVKNTDYANASKAGVLKINGNAARISSDGVLSAAEVSEEQYKTTVNSIFISRGTLENIKNDYVGSSTPVQDLTSTVTNIQEEQDESKPKNTASGEMITVDDAIKYKLFNFMVDGASEQETTTGNQLINWENNFSKSTGVSFSFTDDILTVIGVPGTEYQSVTYNITDILKNNPGKTINYKDDSHQITNSSSESMAQIAVRYSDGTSTFYRVVCNYKTNQLSSYKIPDDISNINRVDLSIFTNNSSNTDMDNTVMLKKPLLYFDDNDIYEPYTGGQPSPSPDYPQEIKTLTFNKITRLKKNLLNNKAVSHTSNGITFTVNEDKTITVNGTATGYTTFRLSDPNNYLIPIIGNYISGGTNKVTFQIMNKETNSFIQLASSNSYKSTPINKTQFNRGYFELAIREGTTVNNEIIKPMMTIEPITNEEYEPYQEQTYDIDLQGNEMVELPNGVKDELVIDKEGNVSLIKNVGKIVLDGSDDENWFVLNFAPRPLFDIKITDILSLFDPSIKNPTLCTNFISYSPNDIWMTNITGICVVQDSNIIRIGFKDNPYQTSEEFKNWLSTHNTTIYYQLEEPQTIPLGTLSELITTLNGTNNISINGNIPTTISTTYALDTKKYIDKKLAEISTAMIEEG